MSGGKCSETGFLVLLALLLYLQCSLWQKKERQRKQGPTSQQPGQTLNLNSDSPASVSLSLQFSAEAALSTVGPSLCQRQVTLFRSLLPGF